MHKIHGVTLSIPSIALHGKTVYYKAIKGKHPNNKGDHTMKKIIACICIAAAAFLAGHLATIYTLEIETDGDGDSAFVTSFGVEHFYGINGYTVD
nr:MAG TPA: hypothetical protein [Caudoviricetes sp.]